MFHFRSLCSLNRMTLSSSVPRPYPRCRQVSGLGVVMIIAFSTMLFRSAQSSKSSYELDSLRIAVRTRRYSFLLGGCWQQSSASLQVVTEISPGRCSYISLICMLNNVGEITPPWCTQAMTEENPGSRLTKKHLKKCFEFRYSLLHLTLEKLNDWQAVSLCSPVCKLGIKNITGKRWMFTVNNKRAGRLKGRLLGTGRFLISSLNTT